MGFPFPELKFFFRQTEYNCLIGSGDNDYIDERFGEANYRYYKGEIAITSMNELVGRTGDILHTKWRLNRRIGNWRLRTGHGQKLF